MKRPDIVGVIRETPDPAQAMRITRQFEKDVRRDWDSMKVAKVEDLFGLP